MPSDKIDDKDKVTLLDLEHDEDIPFGDEMQEELLTYTKKQRKTADTAKNFLARIPKDKRPNHKDNDAAAIEILKEFYKLILRKHYNREVHATFLGPIPWMMTSMILDSNLYLSTWVSANSIDDTIVVTHCLS